MNEQFARRVQKLMKINMKCEVPPEIISRLVNDSIGLDNRITGKSDKEVIDILILKDDQHDSKSIGLMYHILTSADNLELYQRIIRFINGGGVEYWHNVLCNMNMILFECWPHIHLACREQLVRLIREAIRQNVKQIENVLMNAYRMANGCFDNVSKQRIFAKLAAIIRENDAWFKSQKAAAALVGNIITCTTSVISYTPAPITASDTFRESMTDFVCWVIRNRKMDCLTLGRDFMLVLIRLGRLPQVEEIWKDILMNPSSYGVASTEDYWGKNHYLQHVRISIELERKIMFMVHNGGKNLLIYFSWFSNKYFRGNDGPALRAECVRHLLYMTMDPAKVPPAAFENRIQLLHLIVSTAPPGPEQQWLKLCLFADWFGCDDRNPTNFNYVELPLNVVRYALFLSPSTPHPNSIVQGSHCSQFANSLLEYVCKSVDVLQPSSAEYIRRNVNNAMRYCRDRLQHNLAQILENSKIDRKVSELLRVVFPDFVRNPNGSSLIRPAKKKEDQPPAPITKPRASSSDEKPSTSSATPPVTIDKPSSSNTDRLQKEKEDKEDKDLKSLVKLLRGEIGVKMEALRAQWKDLDDDADKCETIEALLQHMLNTEENFDEAQQDLAAQCLQAIMGSVVTPEQSLLPEKEKDLSEAFTHPVYSFMKILCSPPDNDDNSREMLTTMMAAMREKDSSLTYVLLYFIKGTYGTSANKVISCYRDIAKISGRGVDEMLATDLQLCAVNDNRLFGYLFIFSFVQFEKEVMESPMLMATLCANLDAAQLRKFLSEIIREEIKLFRKDTFSKMLMESVEWSTAAQWIFWHLVHADGVPVEWFLSCVPRMDSKIHDEAISNMLLMLKRMDREPWPGLIRSIFQRLPQKDDKFPIDALKVLIEDSDQCGKIAEIVSSLLKTLISQNDILGVGIKSTKKGQQYKLTVQQVLEHLQHFSATCVEKKNKNTEAFLGKHVMQEAFASIRANEKSNLLVKKYSNLFGAMDIIAQEHKEQSSSRTLRGNRQGSAGDKPSSSQQSKRKGGDMDDDSNSKKRKVHSPIIELSDSDSD
ncbi:hypothetical protein L5515_000416 [Caenorhabditis briggsae]|uniref:SOSS complex subunit A homolog n=2 Tax=Caenorhabditis briggsae TaxID=6238 RepID=A0AAE9J296_CAEBR|nr:hypothetical protein L5515_000416 [Caenorhabditis briggsae]